MRQLLMIALLVLLMAAAAMAQKLRFDSFQCGYSTPTGDCGNVEVALTRIPQGPPTVVFAMVPGQAPGLPPTRVDFVIGTTVVINYQRSLARLHGSISLAFASPLPNGSVITVGYVTRGGLTQ